MMFAPSAITAMFPVLLMLLMGGGGGLPLGVPPLPEDPVLSRVAPEECLVYASWSGMATPDAKSKNQTEQLLAEPEVQRLLARSSGRSWPRSGRAPRGSRRRWPATSIRWGKRLLTRPVAAFVSSVGVSNEGVDVHGGLIASVGEDAAELKATMEKYQARLPGGAEKVEIGGISCYRLKLGQGMPAITWGMTPRATTC